MAQISRDVIVSVSLSTGFFFTGLAGCSNGDGAPRVRETPAAIVCLVSSRMSVEEPLGTEQEFRLNPNNDVVHTVDRLGTLEMEYIVTESDDPKLVLREVGSDGRLVARRLYAFSSIPTNQFGGGHGFTGLTYFYPDDSSGEIQYYCTVADRATER